MSPSLTVHTATTPKALQSAIDGIKDAQNPSNHLLIISKSQLSASFKDPASPLFSIEFLATYVDELHNYRNKSTQSAAAVYHLTANAVVRVGLTATPLPTSLENILTEARVIHMHGLNNDAGLDQIRTTTAAITKAFSTARQDDDRAPDTESGGRWEELTSVVKSVRDLLDKSLLRRTKSSLDNLGRPIITLPKLRVTKVNITMREHEKSAILECSSEKQSQGSSVGETTQPSSMSASQLSFF